MNKAFTTIELLVASALAVVLMVGVLHVVGSVQHGHAGNEKQHAAEAVDELVKLLTWDLTNARTIQQKDGKVTLEGYGALDRDQFDPRRDPEASMAHEPVTVEYSVWTDDKRHWLVRRQTHLNDLSNRNAWSELVRWGIKSIELESIRQDGDGSADNISAINSRFSDKGPVPNAVRLMINTTTAQSQIEQIIVLR